MITLYDTLIHHVTNKLKNGPLWREDNNQLLHVYEMNACDLIKNFAL